MWRSCLAVSLLVVRRPQVDLDQHPCCVAAMVPGDRSGQETGLDPLCTKFQQAQAFPGRMTKSAAKRADSRAQWRAIHAVPGSFGNARSQKDPAGRVRRELPRQGAGGPDDVGRICTTSARETWRDLWPSRHNRPCAPIILIVAVWQAGNRYRRRQWRAACHSRDLRLRAGRGVRYPAGADDPADQPVVHRPAGPIRGVHRGNPAGPGKCPPPAARFGRSPAARSSAARFSGAEPGPRRVSGCPLRRWGTGSRGVTTTANPDQRARPSNPSISRCNSMWALSRSSVASTVAP